MKKNFIIYALLILYILLNTFIILPAGLNFYNELLNPFLWIIIAGVCYYLTRDSNLRVKGARDKTQSLLIAMILYIIVYFLSGLLFGFERTPYSKELFSMMRNIWSFGSIVVFQEYVRGALIKNEKKSVVNYIFITLIFTLLEIKLSGFFSNFTDVQTAFIFISSVFIPIIVTNCVLSYLTYIGGARNSIIYRLFVLIPPFIAPIVPSYDWFGTALVGIALPLSVYLYLNYVHVSRTERLSRRERKKYSPIYFVPVVAFIAVVAGFVVGVFKYQPIAVLSGSMSPTFNRGDAVVVKKLNDNEKKSLVKGDVIQFISGTKFVVHRINEVSNDDYGNMIFITKGDHNNTKDADKVQLDHVIGKVVFIIPFIGYPSVWLSGAIS